MNRIRGGDRILRNGFEIIRHQIGETRGTMAFIQFVGARGEVYQQESGLLFLFIESSFGFLQRIGGRFGQQQPVNPV